MGTDRPLSLGEAMLYSARLLLGDEYVDRLDIDHGGAPEAARQYQPDPYRHMKGGSPKGTH